MLLAQVRLRRAGLPARSLGHCRRLFALADRTTTLSLQDGRSVIAFPTQGNKRITRASRHPR
jgi:hypothetical protein